ncbi:MAG TPA: hypothetical protein VND65_14930 [Candidatus Binatia bacterium]|nr:hypothetical protein [Candidatus Binatia bacterium]
MSRIAELFDYWRDYPPVHVMMRAYLGIESREEEVNPVAMAEAMHALTGSAHAQKLSSAPEIDQQRFKALKEMAKKRAG